MSAECARQASCTASRHRSGPGAAVRRLATIARPVVLPVSACLLLTVFASAASQAATEAATELAPVVHENAEDRSSARWDVYDNVPAGAAVTVVNDAVLDSSVIEFASAGSGAGTSNGYRIGGLATNRGGWNDTSRSLISWRMRTEERFNLFITAETTAGFRYFFYNDQSLDRGLTNGIYIHHGLGADARNGQWRTVSRDLVADLANAEPGNTLLSVQGFIVRGNLRLDDLTLAAAAPNVVRENAEDRSSARWDIYDDVPANASARVVDDSDLDSAVIEFSGAGTANGYRIGGLSAARGGWNDTSRFVVSWRMRTSERFNLFVTAETAQGFRYFFYNEQSIDRGLINGLYVHHGLGASTREGRWHDISRDLVADLARAEPDNRLLSVQGFIVRGNLRLDDLGFAESAARIAHETAEDGSSARWDIYDDVPANASVSVVDDEELDSAVIKFSGAGTGNGYRIGGLAANRGGWDETSRFVVSWRMRTDERFAFFIPARTARGFRYFFYNEQAVDRGLTNSIYVHHGLGSMAQSGRWLTVTRDLVADLARAEPGNTLLSVQGFIVRGNLSLDDLSLASSAPVPNLSPVADAGADLATDLGDSVLLDGSASDDPDGRILDYRWTRADGSVIGSTTVISHTPLDAGNETLSLSVTDDDGASATDDVMVTTTRIVPPDPVPDLSTYELVFNDEFSGSTLDPDKWHTGLLWGPYWAINREEQLYVDTLHMHADLAGTASDPFELTGSTLKINATPTSADFPPPARPPRDSELYKRTASNYRYGDAVGTPGEPGYRPPYDPDNVNYLSGIITSYESFKMTHGYVEARAKLPAGRGLWPAFWMLPTHYVEAVPEIDVMEFLGQDVDRLYNTYHFFDVPAGWQLRSTPSFPVYATDWTEDFHTFGMAWSPKKIVWYVDGVETHSITDETVHAASGAKFKIASQAMYLIANLAVGGSWPGAPDDSTLFPATYEIDYIRAYKKKTADPIDLAADYQLMFSDEFNGTTLDPLKWESHFIWGPYLPINNEEQYYVDALYSDASLGYSPFDFDQETIDGETVTYLSITARAATDPEGIEPPDTLPDENDPIWTEHKTFSRNASYAPQRFTSGILTSYESFRFAKGYAEIRARVPKGDGLWPAFWLLNRYYISQQPEIDILEVRGRRPDQAVHNYHRFRPGGILDSNEYITPYGGPEEGYADGFHTFGARWRPGRIDWYVDGVREHSYIGDDVGYQLMYVLVNLAVGGGFDPGAIPDPAEFPKTLDVDYIRIYQEKDTPSDD